MQFQINIPDELAFEYSELPGGIGRAAVEALALEGVRSGRLTDYQARIMLGISTRFEMEEFLRSHGVFLPDTFESVIRDSEVAANFVRR